MISPTFETKLVLSRLNPLNRAVLIAVLSEQNRAVLIAVLSEQNRAVLIAVLSEHGAGIAWWSERCTCDRKAAMSNPGRSGGRIFFSRVNFVCVPQWHVKDPGHSAKSADGRLHLNTHKPLTQRSRSGPTLTLSRHSVEPIRKRAHTQLVREHLVTVVSAGWATVD